MRQEGPARLLLSSGFVPPNMSNQSFQTSSWEISNPQVRRAVSRLCSNWIQDEVTRTHLASQVINMVVEGGMSYNSSRQDIISDKAEIKNWPKRRLLTSEYSTTVEKYSREIEKLSIFGKKTFASSELFELYQSIDEHEKLNIRLFQTILK